MKDIIMYSVPVLGAIGLIYTALKSSWVSKQDVGTERMAGIARHIATGAMAFLKAEYRVLIFFVAAVAILLALSGRAEGSSPLVALSFVLGAFCSALAGYIGMKVATKANVRTTNALSWAWAWLASVCWVWALCSYCTPAWAGMLSR